MSKKVWDITCVLAAVVMAAIALVSAFMGGCPTQVELANGNTAPMRCFWTFTADTYVAVLGIVIALVSMTCKDKSGRRAAGVFLVACAAVVAVLPASFAVGLCAMPEMHCHTTAHIVWALAAVAAIVGLVQIVKADPQQAALPKRTL